MSTPCPSPPVARLYLSADSLSGNAATADRPEDHPEPNRLASAVGHGLRELHQISVNTDGDDGGTGDANEADRGEAAVWQRIEQRAARGRIDPDSLPPPYARYSAPELVELARNAPQGRRSLRWCHTNPQPAQVVVDEGRFVGFMSPCVASIGDRHLDLAIAHLSLQATLGAEAVMGFYEAYDEDPDLVQLDRAMLLALLAGFGEVLDHP